MKTILTVLGIVLLGNFAEAHTLSWDRNAASNVDYYSVYACYTAGCTPTTTQMIAEVDQTASGRPQYVIDLAGKTGTFTVTATATDTQESPFSLPLAFTYPAPVPTNHITSKQLSDIQIEITGLPEYCGSLATKGRGLKRVVTCIP